MKFRGMFLKVFSVLNAISLLAGNSVSLAESTDSTIAFPPAEQTGCSYAENYPCPNLLSQGAPTDGGALAVQTHDYCKMLKLTDKACTQAEAMTFVYGALAAACLMACGLEITGVGLGFAATLEKYCTWGSLGAGLVDMGTAKSIAEDTSEWSVERTDQMSSALNTYLPAGTEFLAQTINATLTHVFARQFGHRTSRAMGSCIAGTLNATIAGLRRHNWKAEESDSAKTYASLCKVHSTNCYKTDPTTRDKPVPLSPTLTGSIGASGAPPVSTSANSIADNFVKDVTKALENGQLAESFASADLTNKVLKIPEPKTALDTALKALQSKGITPQMLARSLATDGVADTLSKLPDINDGMKEAIKKAEEVGKNAAEKYRQINGSLAAFDSGHAAKGSGGSSANASNPFEGLAMGGRGPATASGGAHEVKFGGFSSDIWHAGSQKSLFEIVHDRTYDSWHRVRD